MPTTRVQHQVSSRIHVESVSPLDLQPDQVGVGSGGKEEVKFHPPPVVVVDEVDPGVQVSVLHLGIGGHIRTPLLRIVPDEVVGLAG